MKMDNSKNSKKAPKFLCEMCDFKCCKKNEYERHINTIKHKMVTESNKKTPLGGQTSFKCVCGNEYKYRPGLAKHKRTCPKINMVSLSQACQDNSNTINDKNKNEDENIIVNTSNNVTKDEILLKLIKDNDEMMKIIKGQQEQINTLIPKLGNTTNNNITNNFNLNLFLNEKCKDALNMSEFIDSLKITLEDLLFSKNNGRTRGRTDVIVKIADKERNALQQWAVDNPDWIETEKKQIEYLTMVRSICEPIENFDKYERKIVKNVGKEIIVDKRNILSDK